MPLVWSFSKKSGANDTEQSSQRRVLVTGAAGRIGSAFAAYGAQRYNLRLMIRAGEDADKLRGYGEVVEGELGDLARMKQVCAGVDTVVHMAGNPSPKATWEKLLETNIIGTYHAMVAAKAAGCRRVIYASSIHAVSGYAPDVQVKTSDPVNPGDLYGVTKCFGEALGRYLAEQEDLSVIAIRIGTFKPLEAARKADSIRMMDTFVSERDLCQLISRCVDDQTLRFAIFNGVSDNRFKRLDISDARELIGYAPQDSVTNENPDLKQLDLHGQTSAHNLSDDPSSSGIREELK